MEFEVKDMSCGHCENTIRGAIAAVDPQARVEVDLAAHRVRIQGRLPAAQLEQAIREAGYTPVAAG